MNSALLALISAFVFIVVVDAQAKPPFITEEFIAAMTECKAKLSPSAEDVKIMTSGGKLTTRGAQCLAACIKKKLGIMGSDNKMIIEKTAERLSPLKSKNPELYDKIMSIMKDCKAKETAEADECVAAKKFYDCVAEKREAAGLLPKLPQ